MVSYQLKWQSRESQSAKGENKVNAQTIEEMIEGEDFDSKSFIYFMPKVQPYSCP